MGSGAADPGALHSSVTVKRAAGKYGAPPPRSLHPRETGALGVTGAPGGRARPAYSATSCTHSCFLTPGVSVFHSAHSLNCEIWKELNTLYRKKQESSLISIFKEMKDLACLTLRKPWLLGINAGKREVIETGGGGAAWIGTDFADRSRRTPPPSHPPGGNMLIGIFLLLLNR